MGCRRVFKLDKIPPHLLHSGFYFMVEICVMLDPETQIFKAGNQFLDFAIAGT